ncbi:hypothetical protein KIS4809_4894 [Bacillus sp. ZZV12-4809]|nr:hypothetical protein KIS4809_4894 [Bacillus sp. ZZV12-4809]
MFLSFLYAKTKEKIFPLFCPEKRIICTPHITEKTEYALYSAFFY